MPSSTTISSGLPLIQRFSRFIGFAEEVEEKKEVTHWVEDLKLGCMVVSSLAVVIKTIVALAEKLMSLLQGLVWLGAIICLASLAINACLILSSSEDREKLKETVLDVASTTRDYLVQQLCP